MDVDAVEPMLVELEEEKAADEKLTMLANGGINQAAADESRPAPDDSEMSPWC